jgi:uncharacterized protein (TIGR03118 family)
MTRNTRGGSGGVEMLEGRTLMSATFFTQHNLVSDGAVAADHVDKNLKNPWGLAADDNGPVWVANNGTSTATIYDFGTGKAAPLVVQIPGHGAGNAGAPTGQIYNSAEGGFVVGKGGKSGVSKFIFSTEDGTIAAWSPGVDLTHAVTVVDRSATGAVYKGLAMAKTHGKWFLYATDFANRRVDVFDDHFRRVNSLGTYIDPTLPKTYSPFGIQAVGGRLVVTYARTQAGSTDEAHGAGLGRVTVFRPDGKVLLRLEHTSAMDAPWGVAAAPASWGAFAGDLLVGQFGSGKIAAYSATTGKLQDLLRDSRGTPIADPGLWGLIYGNDAKTKDTLFFDAGIDDEADGLFGSITIHV